MFKVMFLLKRKAGLTHEQFREHYERSHVRLAQKYLGHTLISYERNYITDVRAARSKGVAPLQWDFDCITEWVMANEEALEEVYRIFAIPEIGKEFFDDEERFLDRDAVVGLRFKDGQVVNNGTGGGHGTLERTAQASA